RRPPVRRGRAHGAGDRGGAGLGAERRDGAAGRPPALDAGARGPRGPAGERQDRRGGHALGAAARVRALPLPARRAGRGGRGVAAVAAAAGSWGFLRVSGGVGQDVLYDLRMRVYTHVQRLSLSFYERYTSGRIIARLTNDIDTLTDLLATGLTSLATSSLSIVAISVILLLLDLRLGVVTLLAFPVLLVLTQWFRRNSSRAYRAVRQAIALVIVHYTESLAGIR